MAERTSVRVREAAPAEELAARRERASDRQDVRPEQVQTALERLEAGIAQAESDLAALPAASAEERWLIVYRLLSRQLELLGFLRRLGRFVRWLAK